MEVISMFNKPNIEELQQLYILNPPERMSDNDLLDMDFFLSEYDNPF